MKYVNYDSSGKLIAFYDDGIHDAIPLSSKPISNEEWLDLIEWQGFRTVDPLTKKILKHAIPTPSQKPQKKTITQQLSEIIPGQIVIKTVDVDGDPAVEGRTLEQLTSFPQVVYRFADSLDVYSSGTLTNVLELRQRYGTYSRITPAALGDSFGFNASMDTGSYELSILGIREKDCGILRLEIQGVDQGVAMDWSNARDITLGSGYNVEMKSNIVITNKGVNRFVFKMTSKNAASTGYGFSLTRFAMKKL